MTLELGIFEIKRRLSVMSNALSNFYEALNYQEKRIVPLLKQDDFGVVLRCAINELDWFYYNYSKEKECTEEQQENFYIMQLGVTRLIQLALDLKSKYVAPVVMFPRTRERTIPVLEAISALGIIEHGRRVAQTVGGKCGTIEQVDNAAYKITLPKLIADDQYYENAVIQHYKAQMMQYYRKLADTNEWREIERNVNIKLSELVYPFENHFIGYGAHPLLDDYFYGMAYLTIQMYDGFDTFHYSKRFGGIRYQNYILALTFLISISIRHQRFSEALANKNPNIHLENILTISSDTVTFIDSLREAVNQFGRIFEDHEEIDTEAARIIFEVLSCSRRSTKVISAPGSPLPLIIQCSDQGFIRCLTGANAEPVRFMLDSLRYHFPEDYSKNQNSREDSMQKAITRVIGDCISNLDYRKNIKIKLNGRTITDIDLVIIEEKTGAIILCQLKHQELFGYNIYAKNLRSERLKGEVSTWLDAIEKWFRTVGDIGIIKLLRLPANFPKPIIYRLIITRHFCFPIHGLAISAETAYANFMQLVNICEIIKKLKEKKSLVTLMKRLCKSIKEAETIYHLPEPTTHWNIHELNFSIIQQYSKENEIE